MKQYFLLSILLIQLNFLYAQARQPFKLSNSKFVNAGKAISVSSNKFSFTADDHLDFLFMQCSSLKGAAIDLNTLKDSVEYSPYPSKLYSFRSNAKEFVVLWVTDYEYYPCIKAYYLKGGSISKIGSLEISRPDSVGESFEYPIECIGVNKLNDIIEFSFSKDLNFKTNDNEWKLYHAGSITYSYNITQKKFEVTR